MIKKSFRLMLLVAFALSSVMFVACNKYDDDIERIDNQIAALEQTVQSLKAAVDGGAVISSVSNTADGVKFTLSNGQSYVVNHGTDGAAGAAGKDGSVVTIGENGNWFIDGVDSGKTAKGQGEPGKSPRINEAGNWEVWNTETEAWEDTKVSAAGASTYVVDNGAFYTLNVMEKDAEGNNLDWVSINLPKTAAITSLEVISVGVSGTNTIDQPKTVEINYGKYLSSSKVTFNNVTYPRYSYLVAAGSSLTAIVNPMDADATVYSYALKDSKGNAPYVISSISANSTDGALIPGTKASTPNKGVWNMGVKFAEGVDHSEAKSRSSYAYALTTTTHQGEVASAYDVTVHEVNVTEISNIELNNLSRPVTKSINLMNTFNDNVTSSNGVLNNGTAVAKVKRESSQWSSEENVNNLTPYIVDCYFEIADETVKQQYGLVLDGTTLTAEKPVDNVKINVYYLLVDGTIANGKTATPADVMYASFKYVAPTGSLSDVTWTIDHRASKANVYLPLGDLQSQLVASADTQLPSFTKSSWYRENGYGLDASYNTFKVNGSWYGYYGADADHKFAGNENTWVSTIDVNNLYYINSSGDYVAATQGTTKIQTPLYVKFTFDYTEAFPGEYYVNLSFKKYGASNVTVAVPVKVTIVAPEAPIYKHENYFSGDNAVAYGEADGSWATYNLLNLFKTDDSMRDGYLTFEETEVEDANGDAYTPWLQSGSSTIKVPAYKYGSGVDNTVTVNSTHEYTAVLAPYGNEHIAETEYVFNLTVKSAIAEGSFTTTASKTIETSKGVTFSVLDFNGVDVYGDKFYIGKSYAYDSENSAYTSTAVTDLDSRIASVLVYAADDNAEDYLDITQFQAKGTAAADAFTVTRKAGLQQLVQDTPCKVTVRITDKWGVRSEATVTVVLKKF